MDHSIPQLKAMGLEDQLVSCPRSMLERRHKLQPEQALKCPRCDSANTKFCYYNNYSLSQPRYFCKACRRYWTKGGSLRNVPVGGGCRKNKRPISKKIQDPTQPSSTSPTLLPLTFDQSMGSTNNQNFAHHVLPKPVSLVNPSLVTQIDPLHTGFTQMGTTDLSLYSFPTGFHNQCPPFSHGSNLESIARNGGGRQLVMHNAVENVGFINRDHDVPGTYRDGGGGAWGAQWQNGGGEGGFEEGKQYWSSGTGGEWSIGVVSNYGASSANPFI